MVIDLDQVSFAEWLISLNNEAIMQGFRTQQDLTQETGQFCWYPYFVDGLTPAETLWRAAVDAENFYRDYEQL